MPEATSTVKPDTRVAAPAGEGSGESHADEGVTDLTSFMGGKFKDKTMGDVEDSFKEGQRAKVKAEQNAADLQRKLDQVSSEQSIGSQVAAAIAGMQPGASPEEQRKAWLKEFDGDNGGDAIIDFVMANSDTLKGEVSAALKQEIDGLKGVLEGVQSELVTAREQSDTTYRENKAEIDEMVETYGMTTASATKLYKERFVAKAPESPRAPGESGAGPSRSSEQVEADSAQQAETDKKLADLGTFTPEEIANA